MNLACALLLFMVSFVHVSSNVVELTDRNSDQIFQGSWLIMFYAPWCPACQSLKSPWERLAKEDRTDEMRIAKVDVTKYPALSGQFLIFNLPTIYYINDGECRQYYGLQDIPAIESWVVDGKWRSAEAVSTWRSPNSFIMRSVGKFFHFANEIRVLKNTLTEEYAIPSWIVYIIFIAVTIVMGLLVGLILVCLCDCMCPPKAQISELREEDDNEEDDNEEEDNEEEDNEEKDELEVEDDVQEIDAQEEEEGDDTNLRQRKNTK